MASRKRWQGGYIRDTDVGPVFIIERWRGGRKHHVSTRCTTKQAALKELERFELDPLHYQPGGPNVGALLLTDELIIAYRNWQLSNEITLEWADEVARCLCDWMGALDGRDLRALSLHLDLKPALDVWRTRRGGRIKALKGLYRWLRAEKGEVRHDQDPTVDLKVPQARPEKWRRRKIVPPEDVGAVLPKLPEPVRDVLHLLTATAWHVSEVRRFARAGELVAPTVAGEVLAVLITRQKSGELTKTPLLYPEHVAAARRILERRDIPNRVTLARQMNKACAAAREEQQRNGVPEARWVPTFHLGQMRHSVLTWSVERGATIEQAAEFAHHRSPQTTKRFYVDLAVPKHSIPVLRLLR